MEEHKNTAGNMDDINIDFVERMVKALPSNIYFKDMEGKYVFCTHYWKHIRVDEEDPNWTIRGKYDIDIRVDRENALKAMEEDRRIMETKQGTCYEICNEIDGRIEYLQLIKNPVFDENGQMIGIVGLINDITEMKLLEQKLEKMATTDQLTGVHNRMFFQIWMEKKKETAELPLACIMVDCNGLKQINDVFGHIAGDQYIVETANALKAKVSPKGEIMRTGGDEFLVLLPGTDRARAEQFMQEVREMLSEKQVAGRPVSVSMGAAVCEERDTRFEDYLRDADVEMYQEKVRFHEQLRRQASKWT